MEPLRIILENWVSHEPTTSLWLGVVAVLIFGVHVARTGQHSAAGWTWIRRLVEALGQALLFVALLGMTYYLLSSNFAGFSKLYGAFTTGGSLSNQAWQEWRDSYGEALTQQDLQVTQYITVEKQEEIKPLDSSAQVLYRHVTVEEPIAQSSITGFEGTITISQAASIGQPDSFNAYNVQAVYAYTLTNPTDESTRAALAFPLSQASNIYQDIQVKVNEAVISSFQVISGTIAWNEYLDPAEIKTVSVAYTTQGMDSFVFEIPAQREVAHFALTLAIEDDLHDYWVMTFPESGAIQQEYRSAPPYKLYTWRIERSIMAPRFSMLMVQGWAYAPFHEMITTLPYAAQAAVLFLSLAALTLLICGMPIDFRQVSLLACAFTLPYLVLMTGNLPAPNSISPAELAGYQLKLLPVISMFSLVIAFVVLRKLPPLPLVLVILLMALFLIGYPLIGLQLDERQRNLIVGIVQAGMIAYVFGLTLFMRIRNTGEYLRE